MIVCARYGGNNSHNMCAHIATAFVAWEHFFMIENEKTRISAVYFFA